MARSKLYLGTINVNGLRLGTEDIKMFKGDDKKYPLCEASTSYTASESSASDVKSNVTANTVSWSYTCVTTDNNCQAVTTYGEASSSVTFTENETTSPRTISGNISWNGITIPYSFTQNGQGTYTPPTAKNLTYNGQSQELLNNGTTSFGTLQYSSDGGTTWSTSVPSGTNATSYTLKWRILGDETHEGVPEETIIVEISKVTPTVTAPTAKSNLIYDGSAQALVDSGDTDFGTLQYSVNGIDYATTVPSGTNAANYVVYYKVIGDSNINDVAPQSVNVTIDKANAVVTTVPSAKSDLIYNSSAQTLVNEGQGSTTLLYKLDGTEWSNNIPSGINADSYTVYYKASETVNYNESASGSVEVNISKVTPTVTAPTAKSNLVYDGSAQELINGGSTNYGIMKYNVDGGAWGTSIPSATNGGSYNIGYKIEGDSNINDVNAVYIDSSIATKEVTPNITLSEITYTYDGNPCQPTVTVKDGTTVIDPSEYTITYSDNINAGTATVTITDNIGGNYNVNGTTTFTINKANGTVTTVPTAKSDLIYNGTSQTLVNSGSGTGAMLYKVGDSDWSTEIPTAINASSYTVYYKASASTNYTESTSGSVEVNISKASGNVTTPPTSISELTYNSSAQTLVTEGSGTGTMLYKVGDSDWSTSIPTATNADTYTVYYKTSASTNYTESASGSVEANISKVTPTVTVPTAKNNLVYDGSAQALVDSGDTDFGTMQYSLDNITYSQSIPSGTNAASYVVYYKVVGNSNINDVAAATIGSEIAKANPTYTAPTPKSGLIYDGTAKELLNSGSTNDGTMQYSSDNTNWSTSIPSGTNSSTYTSYWRIVGDTNHNDKSSESITTTIANGSGSVTVPPTPKSDLVYNGNGQELVTEGSGTGTMLYKVGDSDWSTEIPSGVNASSYTVYYKASASTEYGESESGSVNANISKVTPTVTAPTPKTLTYNASAQTLANNGSADYGTLVYSLDDVTYSSSVPTATNANITYTLYYKVSGDSNINSTTAETISCSIAEKRVTTPTITLDPSAYTYNGEECEPTAIVKDGTQVISPSEYTITYENNVNAGTATIVISDNALGNYYISGTTTFTITKASGSVKTVPTAKSNLVYNGTSQTLVTAGSSDTGTMLYKIDGGDWSTSIPTATNADTYIVYYKASASTNYNESASGSVEINISKVTPTVTAPTAKNNLVYNSSAQALIDNGSTNFGTLQYSLDNITYSTTIPSGNNANNYTVYYKVIGDSNINDVAAKSITASIAKADTCCETTPSAKSLTYNGNNQALLNSGSSSCGTIQYSSDNTTWSTSIPSGSNATTYIVYWRIVGDTNHNDKTSESISVTIAKANGSVTTAPTAKSLTYNGSAQALVTAGSGTGTMLYKLDSGSWSTSIPTATSAKDYTVYYKASASTNYNESASGSVSVTISCRTCSVTTAPTAKSLTYNGSAQALANAGTASSECTMYYKLGSGSWSTSIPTATTAGSYTVYYKAVGDDSDNCDSSSDSVSVTISKTDCDVSVNGVSLTYNGSSRNLVTVDGACGTMHYRVGTSGSWSTSIPTSTNAGSWTIYWYMDSSTNYYGNGSSSSPNSVSASIAKASSCVTIRSWQWSGTVGETHTFSVNSGCMTPDRWVSSDSSVATVNSSGKVTLVGVGNTTIYAYYDGSTNYDSSSDYAAVTASCISCSVNTTPSAKSLTYNGSAQSLVTAGSSNCTMQYKLGSGSWSTSIPTATNAGSYTVYYRATGGTNYCNSSSGSVSVSIAKASGSVSINGLSLTYNRRSQSLASVNGATGTMHYSTDYSNWSTSIPAATNAGSYTIYWYMDESSNYNGIGASTSRYVSTSIAKAIPYLSSAPAYKTGLVYNGYYQELISGGAFQHSASDSTPVAGRFYYDSALNAGTYTNQSWNFVPNDNSNYVAYAYIIDSGSCTIAKANGSVTTAPTAKSLTYNGSAQALVNAGSGTGTMLYKLDSGSWSTSIPTATSAKDYTVYYKASASTNYNESASGSVRVTISCKTCSASTTPTAKSLTYNGSAQALVTAGAVTSGCTMLYRLGSSGSYSSSIPTATNAGSYDVYYVAQGNSDNFCGTSSGFRPVTIAKANGSVTTAPTAKSLTYNGSAQALVNAGSGTGTMLYKLDSGSWSTSIPTATNAGDYTVYYKASASTNYYESSSNSVNITINKAPGSVTTAPTAKSLIYNGSAKALVNAGSGTGTMLYALNYDISSYYSTSIPSATNVGDYTVYYKASASTNYNESAVGSVTSEIICTCIGANFNVSGYGTTFTSAGTNYYSNITFTNDCGYVKATTPTSWITITDVYQYTKKIIIAVAANDGPQREGEIIVYLYKDSGSTRPLCYVTLPIYQSGGCSCDGQLTITELPEAWYDDVDAAFYIYFSYGSCVDKTKAIEVNQSTDHFTIEPPSPGDEDIIFSPKYYNNSGHNYEDPLDLKYYLKDGSSCTTRVTLVQNYEK